MKKNIFPLILLFVISLSLHAQEPKPKKPGHFGLSFSGITVIQDSWEKNHDRYGGGTYDFGAYNEKLFYTIGFNYLKPLSPWLDLETGLEYSRKVGEVKNVSFGDVWIEKANTTMASIPLTLRANFHRFFFINGGLLTDFDLGGYEPKSDPSQRYQSGIGIVVGLGAKYEFKSGGQIFVNPYFKRRAIHKFSSDEDRLRMDEAGIRVGFYFKGKKMD